jgi:hypothetical protein
MGGPLQGGQRYPAAGGCVQLLPTALLNIGRPEERTTTDLSRLSDAELVAQLADQAKQLGIEIDLNYRFLQQPAVPKPKDK